MLISAMPPGTLQKKAVTRSTPAVRASRKEAATPMTRVVAPGGDDDRQVGQHRLRRLGREVEAERRAEHQHAGDAAGAPAGDRQPGEGGDAAEDDRADHPGQRGADAGEESAAGRADG
jgi:hypothetical protein